MALGFGRGGGGEAREREEREKERTGYNPLPGTLPYTRLY